MDGLEQVTVLMTLMRQLEQVMDHERELVGRMRLDSLSDIQAEKAALADAYEIELRRLRKSPEIVARVDPLVRAEFQAAMRDFQASVGRNASTLQTAILVAERVVRTIGDGLADLGHAGTAYKSESACEPRGRVIPLALDRQV